MSPRCSGTKTRCRHEHRKAMLGAVKAPLHQIRAQHTHDTITVYQAYAPAIGVPAARQGRFPRPGKKTG